MNPAAHLRHLYFRYEGLPPQEKRIMSLLKADQAAHIDEIVEQLETEMSPSGALGIVVGDRMRDEEVSFKLRAVPRAKWNTTGCSPEICSLLLPMSSTMLREGARSGTSASLSPATSAESEFS